MLMEWLEALQKPPPEIQEALPSCLEFVRSTMGVVEGMTTEVAGVDGSAATMEDQHVRSARHGGGR